MLDKTIILIKQITDGLEFESFPQSEKELKPQLKYYLSLHDDLEIILKSIAVDRNIQSYIDQYKGMRILKQDPWECLISFICSSNSNVLRVKQNVEDMSAAYGEKIEAFGSIRHTFPSPKQLENASIPILRQLKLGYRAEYIHEAVKLVSQHVINPWALLEEIDEIKSKGVEVSEKNLIISEAANLILPFHRELDEIREDAAGKTKIGTTRRGIGPAYEDKIGRRSIRVIDLSSEENLDKSLKILLEHHNPLRRCIGKKEYERQKLKEKSIQAFKDIYGQAIGSGKVSEYIGKTGLDVLKGADMLNEVAANYQSNVEYAENQISNNLKDIARIHTSDLGTRIFYTSQGGYDTHANELPTHCLLYTSPSPRD